MILDSSSDSTLDFDAIHGTSLTDPSKPLVLYWNRQKALTALNNQNKWIPFASIAFLTASIFLPLLLINFLFSNVLNFLIIPFVLVSVISGVLLSLFNMLSMLTIRSDFSKSVTPVMEIHPESLSIHCPSRNFDSIPWSSIKEVKVYTWSLFGRFHPYRVVRIIPVNPAKILEFESEELSQSGRIWPNMSYGKFQKQLKKNRFFRFINPEPSQGEISIDVPEDWLPLSAYEVVEFINLRIARFSEIANNNSE